MALPTQSEECWLDRRHPQYAAMADHWRFVAESYRGGPGWFHEGNLPKYPSEHPTKYAHRLNGATRDNLTKEVVDQHTGYLFKRKPVRVTTGQLSGFWDNAKRAAGDMDDLMAEVATGTAISGRMAVVIDKPSVDAVSAADDKQPYAYTIGVLDLLDYAYDDDGDLLWVLTMERSRGIVDPKLAGSGKVEVQYRLRTRDGWSLWHKVEDKAVQIGIDATWRTDGKPFGRVPLVLVDHQDGCEDYAPAGLVDEIARLDRLISQEQTSLHEVVEWLGAPTLTFPGEIEDQPGSAAGSGVLSLGVAGVVTYSVDAKAPPSYMSPDANFIKALQDRIAHLIDKVRELASLPQNTAGKSLSGESKKWDSQTLQARLAQKAANLQAAEMEIAEIVDLFMGGNGEPECSVQYPTTFDVTALIDDVTAALSLNELPGQHSPTYRVQLAQSLAHKSLPDIDIDVRDAIDAEIKQSITAGDTAAMDDGDGMDAEDPADVTADPNKDPMAMGGAK